MRGGVGRISKQDRRQKAVALRVGGNFNESDLRYDYTIPFRGRYVDVM